MQSDAAVATLTSLHLPNAAQAVASVEDGAASLLQTDSGATIALLRRGDEYDSLVLGSSTECPVPSLRAILERAVLPLSDSYAAGIGVAVPERDAIRKRIREASVALDVIGKGRRFSVAPPLFPVHTEIRRRVGQGLNSVNQLPDELFDDLALINQLQGNVVAWSKEIDRVVQASTTKTDTVLSVEEETVFWSSLDAALSAAQEKLASKTVRISLDVLARNRRATGFLIDANNSIDTARRKAGGVLTLIQGLPLVALRSADDFDVLQSAVTDLLDHVGAKLRVSSFSVERVLGLIESVAEDVSRAIGRVLAKKGGVLVITFDRFVHLFECCCQLFETWSRGFDHCRKVARDSAHKKGETMPPRSTSPLSHLHSHLSDIYELRSDHEVSWSVLHDLLTILPSAGRKIDCLESAYTWLVKECETLDHFEASPARDKHWTEVTSSYRLQIKDVEQFLSAAYEEIAKKGSSIHQLAQSLKPLLRILEKHFISSAISNAIPTILGLARADFTRLKRRDLSNSQPYRKSPLQDVPNIVDALSQRRLVRARASNLLASVYNVVGKTVADISPDLQDFVAEVNSLKDRSDPAESLSTWLSTIQMNMQNLNLYRVEGGEGVGPRVRLSLSVDVASFHVVLRTARDDRELSLLLTAEHHRFARVTKSLFPVVATLRDALAAYHCACDKLKEAGDSTFYRTAPLLSVQRGKAQKVIEEGLLMPWTDSILKLQSHAGELSSKCSAFLQDVSNLLEKDAAMKNAVQDILLLDPQFSEEEISSESISQLQTLLRRFKVASVHLHQAFNETSVHAYILTYCVPRLNDALLKCLERVMVNWVSAVRSAKLGVPSITVEAMPRDGSREGIWCTPGVGEVESFLLCSLGSIYTAIANVIHQTSQENEGICTTCDTDFGNLLVHKHLRDSKKLFCSPYELIQRSVERVSDRVRRWAEYLQFLDPELPAIVSQYDETSESAVDVLETLTGTYEAVIALRRETETAADRYRGLEDCIRLDVSDLCGRISSNILETLSLFCDETTSSFSRKSQVLYQTISNAKESISEASTSDGTEKLLSLQTLKENLIPLSTSSIESLAELESKFEEIAERIGDFSFSRARSAESWIVSEELNAHLKSLLDLHEQKSASILQNHDILQSNYQSSISRYQESLAEAFDDFQKVRSSDRTEHTSTAGISYLDELESRLDDLCLEGLNLERVGRALCSSQLPDRTGALSIIAEVKRVRAGVEKLKVLEENVDAVGLTKIKDVSPSSLRESLDQWSSEAASIGNLSGAMREAGCFKTRISRYLQSHGILTKLHSVQLSAVRERDLLRRLFGEEATKSIGRISLKVFWDAKVSDHGKYLREVFENAAGEASVAEFFSSIGRSWTARKCAFVKVGGVLLLQGIPELTDELEEHLQALETMSGSPYARLFESDRAAWEMRLAKCREELEILSQVQSRWAHMRTLFGSGGRSGVSGLRMELQDEFNAFSNVHARFSSLGERMEAAPGILEGLEIPSGLTEMEEELMGILRGLSTFLEKQRSRFPRFFFLSDSDLLQVLSVTIDSVEGLLPHISKLFPGVGTFKFQKHASAVQIDSVSSKEGEVIVFPRPIILTAKEQFSTWLEKIQEALGEYLRNSLRPAIQVLSQLYHNDSRDYKVQAIKKYMDFPAQLSLLAIKICFTQKVETCLEEPLDANHTLEKLRDFVKDILDVLCSHDIDIDNAQLHRRKIRAAKDQLIKEFVYQRDLLSSLCAASVKSASSHHWNHELRFYSNTVGETGTAADVLIRCGKGEFRYGWEYLGVGETLVHTPLTSRSYLALSEALRRGLGGSPFGPAGTGKTETVKALGRILGRFVAVFNCDESFDSVSVGRILAGACRVGSWVCFDEFNRLSASILSATSGQLANLQASIRKGERAVKNFYGGELPVSITPGVGVFVTMNPTYSGRRELPANLKSLFRPCSMSKPDSLVITEVLLLSQGFKASGALSRKLVSLFQNLKATLPSRAHYDFGLRSLKSTIMASRSLLQSQNPRVNLDEGLREGAEQDIIIRALGENLKPKLNGRDVSVYERAISVVFTEATCYIPRLPQEIEDILECVLVENQLLKDCRLVEKIRQLHSLLQHQRGVMLVGPTGSGKSTAWRTLHDAMLRFSHVSNQENNADQKQIRSSLTVIDAKLLTSQQLYGGLDRVTREWSDGLFTKTLRSLSEGGPANRCEDSYPLDWIVFDGDVDPDWVENLNSVLDDNRILTLPNGEQVPLPEHARIIFETEHLKHANPSTVSRCGMVCFDESYSVEEKLYTSILSLLHEIEPQCAPPNCLHGVAKCAVRMARCVEGDGKLVMQVPLQSMVDSIAVLLRNNLLTMKQQPSQAFLEEEEDEKEERNGLGSYFEISPAVFLRTLLVAIGKSLCCGLVRSKQCEVTQMLWDGIDGFEDVRSAIDGTIRPPNLAEVAMTPHGFYRDYHEMVPSRDSLIRCQDIGSPDVVVPTPTTVQLESLIQESLNLRNGDWVRPSPIILCGPPGCGKSMLLSASLRETPNVSLATLSFSAETSPAHILAALRSHTSITKRPNGSLVLHPKSTGSRVVLFCDEVNLAKPDCYETQAAICLLRSLSEHMGFWQGSPPTWISIRGVQIVAACNPDEDTGRHQLSSRFLRHCRLVRVEQPHPRDISVIYGAFVRSLLRSLDPRFEEKSSDMTAAMVEFFSLNTEKFCPPQSGPLQPHYIYSPRDLSRWIRGMRQLLPTESRPLADCTFETSAHTEYSWTEVVAAFCYEARRIFCDRLLLKEEQSFADNALREIVKRVLHVSAEPTSVQLYSSWLSNDDESCSERRFRIVSNPGQFRTLIYRKLRVFAEEEGLGGSWMGSNGSQGLEDASTMIDQFAVTDDVLTHLTRLDRILNQPLGHAVLMGAPGTGKKTLARFAAWMLSTEVHQVHSHSAYTAADFAGDLRKILRQAGVNSRQIMLIFDESNAMDSAFLEMMNSLLACGEVPGLFSGDERARLLEDLKTSASGTTTGPNTEQSIYAEFVRRVRLNLHIVFTISTGCSGKVLSDKNYQRTVGGNLSQRSPALFNRCMVDWLGDWNPETLEAVAELKIEVSLGHEKDQIIRSAVRIHDIARKFPSFARAQVDVTPRHYLEFIEQLNRLALEKGKAIQGGVDRHTEGLRRLRNAGNAADVLKDDLREKSERLQEKEVNANQTLERMVEEQRMAEKSKVDAEQLAVAAQEASLRVREREDEVSAQLAAVLPKVEAARDAVGSIRREFLEELRAMPHPPAPVRIALEGVLMILDATSMGRGGGANYTWNNIRSRMRGSEFITTVVNFNAESLPRGARGLIEKKIIQNPDFDVNRITYASRAAGPLAEWTISVLDFATVKEDISPMQKEVLVLQEEQEELLGKQEDALEEVAILQQRIQDCRAEYALLVSEAEKVRQEIKESEESLMKSEDMLDSLAQEWDRWVKELNSFNAAAVTVWGNAVYAAAFVAYAGVLDHVSRSQICEQWKEVMNGEGIPFDEKMSLSEFLTSAEERGFWSAQGLPTDCTSLENYAILKRSARFPLVIDPSRNGSILLRKVLGYTSSGETLENRDKPSNAEAVRISESSFSAKGKKSYMRSLESAMRFGTSIFLEDAEKFDRAVTPLLGQESSYGDSSELVHSMSTDPKSSTSTRGGTRMRSNICQRVVRLGDRDVFLSSSFRLYMIGGNIQNIPTAAVTRSNVVSFDLSPAALHASCVSRALRILSPELEEKRKASLAARQAYQRRKHELEESVLSAITDVEDLGTELLGGSLLDSLTRLKQEVELIVIRQEEEAKSFRSISEAESSLDGLGHLAVDLFGVLQSLVHLNPVYQFPISIFLRLFDESLLSNTVNKLSAKGDIAEACQQRVVEKAFYYLAPSLFPQDRLPFACALAIVTSSYIHGSNAASELDCMMRIRHAMRNALDAAPKGQLPLHEHGSYKVLKSLPSHLQSQVGIRDKGRETETFSTAQGALRVLSTTLHEPHCLFESINVLACTLPGGRGLVHSKGTNSVTSLRQILKSFAVSQGAKPSSKVTLQRPLLLCARGENSDPATIVADIANQLRISTMSVAMGGAHTAESVTGVISRAFEQGEEGRRVLLLFKNMHLASKAATECLQSEIAKRKGLLPFLCVLVIEVSSQFSGAQVSATAPFFRLLAFEAPPSFRDNFSSAMDKIAAICQHSINVWKDGDVNVESYQIATSWLHASLVERSAHAPIGFSKCYDFSESDLIASWEIVSSRLAKAPRPQDAISAIAHMLTDAIYGCRIELDADLDIVRAVVGDIFSAERLVPSSKTGTVKVLDGSKHGTIPLNNDERKQHVRDMPLQAPPWWTHMPFDTKKRMQTVEGRSALAKMLALSEKKFGALEKDLGPVSELKHTSSQSTDSIIDLAEGLSAVKPIAIKSEFPSPLELYTEAESNLLFEITQTVLQDVEDVFIDKTKTVKPKSRIARLRKDLLEGNDSNQVKVPEAWTGLSCYFGSGLPVSSFFSKLKDAIEAVGKIKESSDIYIAAVPRPAALLEALKYDHAMSQGISPTSIVGVLTGQSDKISGSRRLVGAHLSRGEWNPVKGVFTVGYEGKVEAKDLFISWVPRNEDPEKENKTYVQIPLYGRGFQGVFLTSLEIPVDGNSSRQDWRLCGASVSLD